MERVREMSVCFVLWKGTGRGKKDKRYLDATVSIRGEYFKQICMYTSKKCSRTIRNVLQVQ